MRTWYAQALFKLAMVLVLLSLAACVSDVDEDLPVDELPVKQIGVPVALIASLSHPTSYLPGGELVVGEEVEIVGMDQDAQFSLVLYEKQLGWMPTIFFTSGIGRVSPAVTLDPPPPSCARYLGTSTDPSTIWQSIGQTDLFIYGSVYRPAAEPGFADAQLSLYIDGSGTVATSDYLNLPLTPETALVLFGFSVTDLETDSTMMLELANTGTEALSYQAAYFEDLCPSDWTTVEDYLAVLPIGAEKLAAAQISETPHATEEPTGDRHRQTPEARSTPNSPVAPTPNVLRIERGVAKPKQVCKATYTSRLAIGDDAVVISRRLNVRDWPDSSRDNVVMQVGQGAVLRIFDGPRCSEEMVWWNVQTSDGSVGWVSEGVDDEYLLEPLGAQSSQGVSITLVAFYDLNVDGVRQIEEPLVDDIQVAWTCDSNDICVNNFDIGQQRGFAAITFDQLAPNHWHSFQMCRVYSGGRNYANCADSGPIYATLGNGGSASTFYMAWYSNEVSPLDGEAGAASADPRSSTRSTNRASDERLRSSLVRKSQQSRVPLDYPNAADDFIDSLIGHLDSFRLAHIGITRSTMEDVLGRRDAGDRLNGLVQEVWDEWLDNADSGSYSPSATDPAGLGYSPFRELVIRMVQGRQERLTESQQRALHSYFSRAEQSSTWRTNMDGVIGAVNRENFR